MIVRNLELELNSPDAHPLCLGEPLADEKAYLNGELKDASE
jgi:hypothetical protein